VQTVIVTHRLTTTTQIPAAQRARLLPAFFFALLVLANIALFLVPAWIIQPFKYQSPRALSLALTLRQFAPWVTLLFALAALALGIKLWSHVSRWKKGLLVVALLFAATAAVMSRVDYFEWMFHPLATPGFESAQNTKLDAGEMVMAVRFGNDARAYPIRLMAYHHVLNDVVNGVPVTVTY
jgi:hypothetical protein